MKICFIAHLNDLSGANRSLLDLAKQLKNSHNITVIVPRKGELFNALKECDINCKIIPSALWMYSTSEKKIKILLKYILNIIGEILFFIYFFYNKFDLVHFNSSTFGCGAKSLKILKRKYSWHIRELAEETFNLKFFNKRKSVELINNSERIIAISNFIAKKISKDLLNSKIVTIYNGISIPSFKKLNKVDIKNFLFVGAINDDKGQLIALEALKLLKEKYNLIIPIIFLGKIINFEYYENLKKYIIDNNLEKYVNFEGYHADISKYRVPENIVLMCSKQEAFGRVTIEALANQQIFIGNNTGATPEIIQSEINGFLYSNTSDSLSEKMYEAINLVNKEEFIKNAYEYVKKEFSIINTFNNVNTLFINIINEGK